MNVYKIKSMAERLSGNTYPGRGIVLGAVSYTHLDVYKRQAFSPRTKMEP